MTKAVVRIVSVGMGLSLQDTGRPGWRRFGVPVGGAMDRHALRWANQLAGNTPDAVALEVLMQGAEVQILRDTWVAIAGADAGTELPTWHAARVSAGTTLRWKVCKEGVWSYLAVEGGFDAPHAFGSASFYARGPIGMPVQPGSVLHQRPVAELATPSSVAHRWAGPGEQRNYRAPGRFRVWPGPQWDRFTSEARAAFFDKPWRVSARSDRMGYRLEGDRIPGPADEITSEPVLPGSIQVPPDGQPIVTLHDGPTVGGYPKLGLLDHADMDWFVQCQAGQLIRFTPHEQSDAEPV